MKTKATFKDECIMSIVEARKLMPDTTSTMSDREVESLIESLHLLAGSLIDMIRNDDELRVNIAYNRYK